LSLKVVNIESKPNNMNISYFLLKNINKNYIDKNEYKPIICTENDKIIKLNGNINGVILSKNSENITEKDIEKYINDKRKSILKFINENNYNMVVDIYKGFKENLCPFIGRINFYNRLEF
jgi:ADP-heptose:LPS heptosyltransferase